jgi:hypothetical protein
MRGMEFWGESGIEPPRYRPLHHSGQSPTANTFAAAKRQRIAEIDTSVSRDSHV